MSAEHGPVGAPLRLAFLADPNSIHTHRWLAFFEGQGHRIDLLVAEEDPITAELPTGVVVHRYPRRGRSRVRFVSTLRGRSALRRLLAELRPDILHAQYLARYGWQAHLSGFRPRVVTLWGSDVLLTPGQSRRARLWSTRTLRAADLITVPAEHLAAAAEALGAPPGRVHLIEFGADLDRFGPERRDPAVLERFGLAGRRLVYSPRALTPLYRHEDVLRATAGLPDDVVILAGARNADPAYLEQLRALASELGLSGRFVVAPEFSDEELSSLMAASAVVVSVPASDGLPLTVLEAMASAVPVIATDLPGPRRCLDGHPELLVPVGDAVALRAALDRALALTADDRAVLGQSLRQRAVAEHDQKTHLLRMEELYRSLVSAPSSGSAAHASTSASRR